MDCAEEDGSDQGAVGDSTDKKGAPTMESKERKLKTYKETVEARRRRRRVWLLLKAAR